MLSILCGIRVSSCISILRSCGGQLAADLPQIQGQEQKRGELAGKGLRRGHADFGAGVRVDRAGRFAREHRADHVADRQHFRALSGALRARAASVSAVSPDWLMDHQAVLVEDGIAIAELAAVIHFHRHVRQPLDHEFPGERRVPTGTARDDLHFAEIAELLLG